MPADPDKLEPDEAAGEKDADESENPGLVPDQSDAAEALIEAAGGPPASED